MEMRRCTVDEILRLRQLVLRAGKPIETARFDGDDIPTTLHYALFESDTPVVCLTLLQRPPDLGNPLLYNMLPDGLADESGHALPMWQLRGMATAAQVQGRGLGTKLINFALNDALREGYSHAFWCNARLRAVPFYQRNGWSVISEEFDVPGIGPHHQMFIRL